MLFNTIIMFIFLIDKFLITSCHIEITNLLGSIGLTLTFISGILGIKAYSIEIMKQLKTIFTKL